MKKVLIVVLIAILAAMPIVFAACSRVSQTDMISDPYVADNSETFIYKMYYKENVIGSMTLTFKKLKAASVTLPDPTAENNERAFTSFSGTQLSMAYTVDGLIDGVQTNDEGYSEVLYGNNYSPAYSYKHESIGDTVRDMCVVYETKYAYTYLYENGEEKNKAAVKVKNTTHFDNEMIYAVVRASRISSSSYTMSFSAPNARLCKLERISVSKVQEVKLKDVFDWAPKNEEGEAILSCYAMRVSISNSYASPYSMLITQNIESATFRDDEDQPYTVENVHKVIVRIAEGDYLYLLDRIVID